MANELNLRQPCVSGQFYPSSAAEVNKLISILSGKSVHKQDVLGCVLPHAGYVYSGRVAARTLAQVNIKDTVILLGPNHSGNGAFFSLMPAGFWRTPLGDVEIDAELAGLFLSKSRYLKADTFAHLQEHSLEVELPLLQYFRKDFKIVPITIKSQDLSALRELAEELVYVIEENNLKRSVMFIASSDLTHYEPLSSAKKKDSLVIEAISDLDEYKLAEVIKEFDISMCGFAPVAVLIKAAKSLGAKQGELVKYQTSGEVSKDISSVVGYAGITIK